MLSKTLISNFIISSFTTYPPQHSHLCYMRHVHMSLLDRPTFYSIGHSRCNCCCVKSFFRSYWHLSVTKHFGSKSPIQLSRFYFMVSIFINLLIITNYRVKLTEIVTSWYLMVFNSYNSFNFFLKLQFIYYVFVRLILKLLDSKASCSLIDRYQKIKSNHVDLVLRASCLIKEMVYQLGCPEPWLKCLSCHILNAMRLIWALKPVIKPRNPMQILFLCVIKI